MPEHATLAAALVAALADLTVVDTANTANAGSYSYKYADLGDVVKLTRPVLAAHGIAALTPVHDHGAGLACTVILIHASGERVDLGPLPFPAGKDAQATGSMLTYHRRYALLAALGMATGQDDDGAAAVARHPEPVVPGFRSSLLDSIAALTGGEKQLVKEFMAEHDLPPVRRMTADQADKVAEYVIHMPAVPEETT